MSRWTVEAMLLPDFLSKFCRINIYKVKFSVLNISFGLQGYLLNSYTQHQFV